MAATLARPLVAAHARRDRRLAQAAVYVVIGVLSTVTKSEL